MTVSSEVARVVHTANGTATFFSYAPMDGVTSANLKVYLFNPTTGVLTLQTLGTDYTFGSGGVTFNTAPPSGRRVILLRQVELLQPDVYKTNAPFPAAVTEKRLDEIVKGLQQINDVVQNRSIILPAGDAGFSSNVLPAVENRKGGVLYFNATTGDPEAKQLVDTIVAVPAWASTFLSQSTAAAGLTSLGGVAKAGDTMTGPLTVPNATAGGHALNRDTGDSRYLRLSGGTMAGLLTLSGAPTATNHAANKGYVDTEVGSRVAKAGDTMTGNLDINATHPWIIMRSATPSDRAIVYRTGTSWRWVFYVTGETESGGNAGSNLKIDRYSDTGFYLNTPFQITRSNGQITFDSPLPILGPSATPTAANHLATKSYVDSMSASGNYVQKTGDTMTGFLTLHDDPTANLHAATKAYVDRRGPGGSTGLIATPSGTTYDVTGIPSWVNVVEVLVIRITTAANTHIRIRLGTSNGFVTSGYRSTTGSRGGEVSDSTAFVISPANTSLGVVTIIRMVRANGNVWVQNHAGSEPNNYFSGGGGSVDIEDTLTQLRLFITASNFTGGHFVVRWTA